MFHLQQGVCAKAAGDILFLYIKLPNNLGKSLKKVALQYVELTIREVAGAAADGTGNTSTIPPGV